MRQRGRLLVTVDDINIAVYYHARLLLRELFRVGDVGRLLAGDVGRLDDLDFFVLLMAVFFVVLAFFEAGSTVRSPIQSTMASTTRSLVGFSCIRS